MLKKKTLENKEKYREFYKQHHDICIFSSPWWLDTLAGAENWDVILIEKNNNIIASFPFVYKKRAAVFKQISMPLLTQKLGPYILYDKNKITENKRISYEHEIYQSIIEQLPEFDIFNINFDQKYKNWLPFYWNNFLQTSRYSYQINNIKNHESVLKNFVTYKKQKIKKGIKKLNIKYDLSAEAFYGYFKKVVNERGEPVLFSEEIFCKLTKAIYENNAGRILYCTDSDDNIHAVNLTVWDNETAFYLIAMREQKYNTSGGTEFLVYETIKYVSQFVDVFDFEGSMMKGVEASYRFYGSTQTEYYSLSKVNNRLLKIYKALK